MDSRFKTSNIFALLIAIILIAIGFGLSFIHKQSESGVKREQLEATTNTKAVSASHDSLSHIALIHEDLGESLPDTPIKTELDQIRESIDWSDAPSPAPELVKTDDYDVYINVTREYLLYVFDKVGYTGDKIDSGETTAIPPLLVVSIKKGWSDGETVQFKKSIFYRVILSLVLYENEAVLREREELLAILESRKNEGGLPNGPMKRLNQLAFNYRVIKEESKESLSADQIRELLVRVDMVPPSLALAQAAHESGYATSRFAHSANALFGQWDWSANAIKPQQQRKGMGNYGIKSFDQPIDSVRAYIWNLNTHRAYAGFRKERAQQRGNSLGRIAMDSKKLAATLTSYSERGAAYTDELQETIRFNSLDRADNLRLIQGRPIYFD